jgi:hypothetical protein
LLARLKFFSEVTRLLEQLLPLLFNEFLRSLALGQLLRFLFCLGAQGSHLRFLRGQLLPLEQARGSKRNGGGDQDSDECVFHKLACEELLTRTPA